MSREYVQKRLADIKRDQSRATPTLRRLRPWRQIEGITVYPDDWNAPKIELLSVVEIERLPEVDRHCRRAGVYFLLLETLGMQKLQYIGSSTNMTDRLGTHRSDRKIHFTKATHLAIPWPWHLTFEALYIRHYSPPMNSAFVQYRDA